jgi:predicted transcriptional regulator
MDMDEVILSYLDSTWKSKGEIRAFLGCTAWQVARTLKSLVFRGLIEEKEHDNGWNNLFRLK